MQNKICIVCNKKYKTYNKKSKFCSQYCYQNNPLYKNGMKGKENIAARQWNLEYKSKQLKDWWSNPNNKKIIEKRNKNISITNKAHPELHSHKGEKNGMWLGGICNGEYGYEFNRKLKINIMIRDKFRCFICHKGINDFKGFFVIHHIDYNKKNNNEKNLVTLCPTCHSKTNTKRHIWINYFSRQFNIEKQFISWEQLNEYCIKISEWLKDKSIDGFYPIIRGGVIPAVILSNILDKPIVEKITKNTIIVDEIVDFGFTIKKYKKKYPNNLFVSIHLNKNNFKLKNYKPDFYIEEIDKYIVYPWELEYLDKPTH